MLLASSLVACGAKSAPANPKTCYIPEWPAPAWVMCQGQPDEDVCFFTKIALYVRDAERVYTALQSCPNVKEVPYEALPAPAAAPVRVP